MKHILRPSYCLSNVGCRSKAYCDYCYLFLDRFAPVLWARLYKVLEVLFRCSIIPSVVQLISCEMIAFLVINKVAFNIKFCCLKTNVLSSKGSLPRFSRLQSA